MVLLIQKIQVVSLDKMYGRPSNTAAQEKKQVDKSRSGEKTLVSKEPNSMLHVLLHKLIICGFFSLCVPCEDVCPFGPSSRELLVKRPRGSCTDSSSFCQGDWRRAYLPEA